MTATDNPYPLPYPLATGLSPVLMRVLSYWRSLERGENDMPFWDDVNLSMLPDLADRLLLIDVFANPERFRFNTIGGDFVEPGTVTLIGRFADEVELSGSLKYLRSQSSATVEARAPTLYRSRAARAGGAEAFSRLLLPMWGDGHIGMLLGALDAQVLPTSPAAG